MTAQRKPRGAYSVGQATRESILSAAMVLIAERGYNGFSLRDLGRRVGISHPAVVYHFPSKEAILRAAIQRHEDMNALFRVSINEDVEGGFEEGGITAESFVDWAVGEMRFAMMPEADNAIALDCVLWAEASSESHPAHIHYKYRTAQMEEALTSMIMAFIEESRVDIGTKPRTLAKILIRYWYGSVVSARYADEPIDAREFVSDYVLPGTDGESEYLARFERGDFEPSLLFGDGPSARAALASPEAQWKLQNIRKMQR